MPLFDAFCPLGQTGFRDRGGPFIRAIAMVGFPFPSTQGTGVGIDHRFWHRCWHYRSGRLQLWELRLDAPNPGQSHLKIPAFRVRPGKMPGNPQAKMRLPWSQRRHRRSEYWQPPFVAAIRSSVETNRERISFGRLRVDTLLTSGNTSPCCSRVGAVFPDDVCINTVDRNNRRREEADVSSGFRVYDPNAQVTPTRLSRRSGNPEPFVSIYLLSQDTRDAATLGRADRSDVDRSSIAPPT